MPKIEEEEKKRKKLKKKKRKEKETTKGAFIKKNEEEESGIKFNPKMVGNTKYVPPPLSLLEDDKGRMVSGDIKANANIIKRTLQNFGIDVEMDEVSIGPSVTRYALKPAEGVKISELSDCKMIFHLLLPRTLSELKLRFPANRLSE